MISIHPSTYPLQHVWYNALEMLAVHVYITEFPLLAHVFIVGQLTEAKHLLNTINRQIKSEYARLKSSFSRLTTGVQVTNIVRD